MRRMPAATPLSPIDLEEADVAGARDVRAAAQLARRADVEHAHFVAVLLAEQHHRAGLLRLVDRHHARLRRGVVEHLGVDDLLDAADLARRSSARCARSRSASCRGRPASPSAARAAPSTSRSALCIRCVAEWLRIVRAARRVVDLRGHRVADPQLAGLHLALVPEHVGLHLLRVGDGEQRQARAALGEFAAVADLAAGLRVERRAVEHDDAVLARGERVDRGAVAVQRDDAAFLRQRVVAVERGLRRRRSRAARPS